MISGDGGDAVLVHQDAHVYVSRLQGGTTVSHPLASGRGVYLYVIEGEADVVGERMTTGTRPDLEDRVPVTAAATTELIAVDVSLKERAPGA